MIFRTFAFASLCLAISIETAGATETYPIPMRKPAIVSGAGLVIQSVAPKPQIVEPTVADNDEPYFVFKPLRSSRHTMCASPICPGFLLLGTAY